MIVQKASVCPLDCPDTCSLAVGVENGQVVRVRGSKANPITHGAICAKVAHQYPEFVHGPGRLRYPLLRRGSKGQGEFERTSWEQALEVIHARVTAVIGRYGAQAVLPLNYAGPHGMLAGDSMSLRFFHRLGASLLARDPLCGGIRSAAYSATFGDTPGTPLQQVSQAQLIVVWGNNASVCNLHLMRQINAARRRGAKLIVVDPRRTRVAEQAELHLPVRPGTDVVLAWAIAVELERLGGLDHAFIAKHVLGFEPFMAAAREYPPERAAQIWGCRSPTCAPSPAGTRSPRPRSSPGETGSSAIRTAARDCGRSPRYRHSRENSAWPAGDWWAAPAGRFRRPPIA